MKLDTETGYQAILTKDTRFDGIFYVGVSTTGVYCRTVCRARTPRRSSCSFYPSAASAERAGFRPCLLCRPELAPGNARIDAAGRLAAAVASRIEEGVLAEMSLEELASDLQVSSRHLRRVVDREFGVSPVELAQTQRLLLAKRLLTDTDLSMTETAFASGFSSLRRFNALFKDRYRLSPSTIRQRRSVGPAKDSFRSELAYRPPLDWTALLDFLRARAIRGVELVDDTSYKRTVRIGACCGWIALGPSSGRSTIAVELSRSLIPVVLPVLTRVKRLLDLSAEPVEIALRLGRLARGNPGLRVPGAFDGFEVAVRAILGQQVSVRAATTLAGRLASHFGEPIATPFDGLDRLTPAADRVAAASVAGIASLGITAKRAESIRSLARGADAGRLRLDGDADPLRLVERIQTVPGIGEWTAQYLAMRLGWPDAFPRTDLGIRKALPDMSVSEITAHAEQWRPWRSYAVMHLWKSLERAR